MSTDQQTDQNERNDENETIRYAAETFLDTLRRSTELAQKLLSSNRQMAIRTRSLEDELSSAKARIAFLERETSQLRNGLSLGTNEADALQQQLQALAEEQNCLAHLFVTSDRFAQVTSPQEALSATEEVLHNLIGATDYGIWLRADSDSEPALIDLQRTVSEAAVRRHMNLVEACLKSGRVVHPKEVPPNKAPLCVPLKLDEKIVGVMLIGSLVPQANIVGRLQRDLLHFLGGHLASSMCIGALQSGMGNPFSVWKDLQTSLKCR